MLTGKFLSFTVIKNTSNNHRVLTRRIGPIQMTIRILKMFLFTTVITFHRFHKRSRSYVLSLLFFLITKAKSSKKMATAKKRTPAKWSGRVMQTSNALDLQSDIFKLKDPAKIAQSLKRSAESSKRRKSPPYRSAMSMLTFYINRGGKNLSASQKNILERSKNKLRELFGKPVKK